MKKIASEERPSPDVLATYVDSLKMYAKQEHKIDAALKNAIESLPSPSKIRSDLSNEESNILYETVDWAWKKITGHDIINELKIKSAPEHLMGNYWILKSGVILSGENHFTIIKNNINLFSTLLNVGATTLLGYMGSSPNRVIACAINNGAMRVYVNNKKEFYCQLSDNAYGEWGRNKIKHLDFPEKFVKVIDTKQTYKGWDDGVVVKL